MDELKVEENKKQEMENKKHSIESKIRKEFDGSNKNIFCPASTSNNNIKHLYFFLTGLPQKGYTTGIGYIKHRKLEHENVTWPLVCLT